MKLLTLKSTLFLLFSLPTILAANNITCASSVRCQVADLLNPANPPDCPGCFGIYGSDTLNSGGDFFAYSCNQVAQAGITNCAEQSDACSAAGGSASACSAQEGQCIQDVELIECDCTLNVCRSQLNDTTSTTTSTTSTTTSTSTSTSTSTTSTSTTTPTCSASPQKRDLVTICRRQFRACTNDARGALQLCNVAVLQACEPIVQQQYQNCLNGHRQRYCARQVQGWVRTCAQPGEQQCQEEYADQLDICSQRREACLQSCDNDGGD